MGYGLQTTAPARCINEVFEALSAMSVTFAEHGPGWLPGNAVAKLEDEYMRYREFYNSCWDWNSYFLPNTTCVLIPLSIYGCQMMGLVFFGCNFRFGVASCTR